MHGQFLWGNQRVLCPPLHPLANPHCSATPPSSTPILSNTSLTPSNSMLQGLSGGISQPTPPFTPMLGPHPLVHPLHLLQSILWMYEDCKSDLLVGLTQSNKS